jgi:hypothetical protein
MSASSLDIKGEGRTMSGAMTKEDIVEYGYESYSARFTRNWDRPSLGVEPLYEADNNLVNGDDRC